MTVLTAVQPVLHFAVLYFLWRLILLYECLAPARSLVTNCVSPRSLCLCLCLSILRILLLSRPRCSQPRKFIDPVQPQASSAWLCWGQAIRCGTWASSSLQHSLKLRALNPLLRAIIILFKFPSTLPALAKRSSSNLNWMRSQGLLSLAPHHPPAPIGSRAPRVNQQHLLSD